MTRPARILVAILAFCVTSAATYAAEKAAPFKVIVNENNPVTSIKLQILSRMFLKKVNQWNGGLGVRPVDLAEASPVRESFSVRVHKKSVAAIQAYWRQEVFSGRDVPPPQKVTDSDVITYVRVHAGAVGYVSANADLSKVKVVAVE